MFFQETVAKVMLFCLCFNFSFSIQQNVAWTPSKVIARLGKEINHESSYLYWAYKVRVQLNLVQIFVHNVFFYFCSQPGFTVYKVLILLIVVSGLIVYIMLSL